MNRPDDDYLQSQVDAAVKLENRLVNIESATKTILGAIERVDAKVGVQNGRLGKAEDSIASIGNKLIAHLQQIVDLRIFTRLDKVEDGLENIQSGKAIDIAKEKGHSIATQRDIGIATTCIGIAIALIELVARPLITKLLGG